MPNFKRRSAKMISRYRLCRAVHVLLTGGIIAYPTEAVYGLGCDPLNADTVYDLLALKRRDADMGLILIASDFDQLLDYITPLDKQAMKPIMASWPGPNTWLLPAQNWVPRWLRGRHKTLAVRVTAHPIAAELCQRFGSPLISTSANIYGRQPARTPTEVRRQFGPNIDLLLTGSLGGLEAPTPIRDARTGAVLRP